MLRMTRSSLWQGLPLSTRSVVDVSWKTDGPVVAMVVAEGLLVVLVVFLIAEVGAIMVVLLVELVVEIPGIGFELCGAEYLVPKRTLYCSANSELDCGADSDCYCTNLMSSGGTDATSC